MNYRYSFLSAAAFLALTATASAAPLPGGASTLTETYQDWSISCQAQKESTNCIMNQMQNSSQTGQRVLTVELRNVAGGKVEGVLLMPFGLNLAKGATLKIDEGEAPALTFSTCLPQGCLAPLSFDAKQVGKLKTAANLNITATALEPSQPVAFKVSLKGFGSALDRIAALTK
ncbi:MULTISPECIES: invasion associated locus B family protein [Brucella/Ochrobactrum group]|uniref:Invasion associated locus B family protein n=2 Tax=Brucella TaxID=234 RepID=A6WY42_BRUA4|nr:MULTISPECIES: invasion associated locus B family protein [Brucella/Ochrobactrum group]RNL41670.1 invasion associated locus B family protein [Ochrobactrum sp. MH181795]ABS13896.1 Invasion associated locus B family protein [Brucella anthropi ATCC 49188]AIK44182.1 invasion associated locus B family protein [Brucella anthropi]KAB2702744.1 invasion associated locus B family protein [Brucella lupini]KAB2723792.1 invasion associated locus B family protein [Brucella anthropi]